MRKANPAILPGAEIIGTFLILKKQKILAFSDTHLGYEASLASQGTLIPRFNFQEIRKELEKVFEKHPQFEKIIINGDFKHSFGKAVEQEWSESLEVLDLLQKHCKEIILVQGNHDVALGPIALWKGIKIEKEGYFLEKEKMYFTHGHKIFLSPSYLKAETVIASHDHVAVTLREGAKQELFKCFLKGKYDGKTIVAMPATSPLAVGVNVLSSKMLSPFLKGDLLGFECWVIADKTYYFGKLENIERIG